MLDVVTYNAELKSLDWCRTVEKSRNVYNDLKEKHFVDPHKDEDDPEKNNPLSTEDGSTWAIYFENKELQQEIDRDVSRTFPENDFFRSSEIQKLMTDILFVFAKENPNLAYKQGMHEILAPIILVLHRERIEDTANIDSIKDQSCETSKLLNFIMDAQFIESDSYTIFNGIMKKIGLWFVTSISVTDRKLSLDPTDLQNIAKPAISPIITKCRRIQDELLKKHDPELYNSLTNNGIEPQLYLLRWIRILFGREFHMEDSMVVWDAIFSFDQSFGLVDYIAVAMLIFIRSQLIERDFAGCIKRLQKYPPVEDITVLIEHAIAISKSVVYIVKQKKVSAHPSTYSKPSSKLNEGNVQPRMSQTKKASTLNSSPFKNSLAEIKPKSKTLEPTQSRPQVVSPPVQTQFNDEVKVTKTTETIEPSVQNYEPKRRNKPVEKPLGLRAQVHKKNQELVGNQINVLIEYLRKQLTKNPDSKLLNPIIQTIAELKRIRDVMHGLIDGDNVISLIEDEIMNDAMLYIPDAEPTQPKEKMQPQPTKIPTQSEEVPSENKFASKIRELNQEKEEAEAMAADSLSSIFDDPLGLFSEK